MPKPSNKIQERLETLGIIDAGAVVEFYPRVRDSSAVKVMKCTRSGVIFLSGDAHIGKEYYANQKGASYWSGESRDQALALTKKDDDRRAAQFTHLIQGKSYLDAGTGAGGMLDRMHSIAREVAAIEPQNEMRKELMERHFSVFPAAESIPADKKFDVISLFHVLEHIADPVAFLRQIREHLAPDGVLIVEIPQANDFLLRTCDLEAFKAFTFWSEHMMLHTRKSFEAVLRAAGFGKVEISGYQRYPLANHIHWLLKKKPGGQDAWPRLRIGWLDRAYAWVLDLFDRTDTLIAIAQTS